MSGVSRGKSFSKKHMAQMSAAVGALNLGPRTVGVRQVLDGSRFLLIERRPPATSLELVLRLVEVGVATAAGKDPWLEKVVVLSGEGRFSSLIFDYMPLGGRKRIIS